MTIGAPGIGFCPHVESDTNTLSLFFCRFEPFTFANLLLASRRCAVDRAMPCVVTAVGIDAGMWTTTPLLDFSAGISRAAATAQVMRLPRKQPAMLIGGDIIREGGVGMSRFIPIRWRMSKINQIWSTQG